MDPFPAITIAGVAGITLVMTLTEIAKRALHLEGGKVVWAALASSLLVAVLGAIWQFYPAAQGVLTIVVATIGLALTSMGTYSGGKALRGK